MLFTVGYRTLPVEVQPVLCASENMVKTGFSAVCSQALIKVQLEWRFPLFRKERTSQ